MTAALPLAGIRVLDLTRALSGPYCTALLGDLGADIVKVEPPDGDITRSWPPFEGEHSLYFESVNRNKRSVVVDFRSDAGKAQLLALALESDVVVENFRIGVMDALGLGSDRLRQRKPDLVVASITAFGSAGPLATAGGLDQVAQAMSGLTSVTGPDADHPYRFGVPIVDMVSGLFCTVGIVAALVRHGAVGEGATVTTSLIESALALSAFHGQQYLSTGHVPQPHGNGHASLTPYGLYPTADIPIVLAVSGDKQWRTFCALLDAPELAADERYATGRGRTERRDELNLVLGDLLRRRPAAEWLDVIRASGIPCGPIYTYDQVFADEQVRALDMVERTNRSDGSPLPLLRGPITIDGRRSEVRTPPDLGADTDAVLPRIALASSNDEEKELR